VTNRSSTAISPYTRNIPMEGLLQRLRQPGGPAGDRPAIESVLEQNRGTNFNWGGLEQPFVWISRESAEFFWNRRPTAPMIARIVSLSIVVKDFAASRSSLDTILVRHHGYSAQLNIATPENAPHSIQASLRIPATALSSAVADLKTLGRVENESQSGEEVTQQHTALVARLKNSRETEQRFRSILQQRTGNVVEVLQVEERIAGVRGDKRAHGSRAEGSRTPR